MPEQLPVICAELTACSPVGESCPMLRPVPVVEQFAIVEVSAGAATVGICGDTRLPTPTPGNTVGVGIAAAELTPRLAISQESSGIPVRAFPPATVGAVGLEDDAAMLLEPRPHIPDTPIEPVAEAAVIPEIGSIPASVDIADVAGVPAVAALADIPMVPIVAALAVVADPIVNPPPS
jgi:hypothetical protein